MLLIFLLFLMVSCKSSRGTDALLYKLDSRLERDFQTAKVALHLNNNLDELRESMIWDLRKEIYENDFKDFKSLMAAWTRICKTRIPHYFQAGNSLQKRLDVMKFVKVAGVVGLTVTYMITVSVIALSGLALIAYVLFPKQNIHH